MKRAERYDLTDSDDRVRFYSGREPYTAECFEMQHNNAPFMVQARLAAGLPGESTSFHCGHGREINGVRRCYWNGYLDGYGVCACRRPLENEQLSLL